MPGPGNRPSFWKRKYLINNSFQVKYIAYIVLASTLISGILGWFIYNEARKNSEILEIQAIAINPDLVEGLSKEDNKVLMAVAAFVLFQALGILIFALMLTHRIAGPLFRVELYLKALADLKVVPVRSFRKSDEFKYLADQMTNVNDALRTSAQKDLTILTSLRSALGENGELPTELKSQLQTAIEGKEKFLAQGGR